MYFKELLIVFPWTAGYKQLSTDTNVKNGHFRIGQLLFTTKLRVPGLIIAKKYYADMYTMDGICIELSTKLEDLIAHYRDGLICEHDYARSVMEVAIRARGFMAHSTCTMRLKHCDETGCPAQKVKGDAQHEETEARYQKYLDEMDAARN